MQLKVCGIKYAANLQEIINQINPNYLGFIFYEKSGRFMHKTLKPKDLQMVPDSIKKVGVFVNETIENIIERVTQYNLQVVQLHGNESAKDCFVLQQYAEVIKAFGVDEKFDFKILDAYNNTADYFLFDTKTTLHGGSGKVFNWNILNNQKINKPYILSGGLENHNIKNVSELRNAPFMLDVNSKYEDEPGLKNIEKLMTLKKILQHD